MPGLVDAIYIGVAGVGIPALAGMILHEVTHAIAVLLLGHDLKGMNLHRAVVPGRRMTVVYEIAEPKPFDKVIGYAPALVGGAVGLAWYLSGGEVTGLAGLAAVTFWSFYTLTLSREDVHSTAQLAEDRHEQKMYLGAFMFFYGVVLWLVLAYEPVTFLAQVSSISGGVLVFYNIMKMETAEDSTQADAQ